MADKDEVSDWDTTAADNDNIGGVPLGENVMLPSNVNNAFRTMMSQIKTLYNTLINSVLFTAQSLTDDQKGQARANIGADTLRGPFIAGLNGDFAIWQEGTSKTGVTTALSYGPDGWLIATSGATVSWSRENHVVGQVTVPGNPEYFGRFSVTSADDNVSFSNTLGRVALYSGTQITITIYGKSPASVPSALAARLVQNFGTGGSPSSAVTTTLESSITITGSFVKQQWVVDVPSISGKTLGSNGDDYLRFTLINTDNETWTLDLSHFSAEPGDCSEEDDPFPARSVEDDFEACRYVFRKSYGRNTAPGTATSGGAVHFAANGTSVYGRAIYVATGGVMRITPTVTLYSRVTGAAGKISDLTGGTDDDASATVVASTGFVAGWTNAGDTADQNNGAFHYTLDARY